ncbi:DUF6950 family protein [Rhodobacter capsulatus]|uniref:DUF6950 family protein n=1 Tax=Rhodobacter capsulatus TaxID=1061 RepID=UPI0003D30173|nr:hypothetical protein [Rhodobacter capsulatus]ETD89946.1 hypothetical protein U713_07500 [Rhodobacter capsulatus YW2]
MAGVVTADAAMAAAIEAMGGPFVWGRADCCTGPADAFAALWGMDPMAPVRGYVGMVGATRMIREAGGLHRLAAHLAATSGLREVDPAEAKPGAIGVVANGFGHSLGLCVGPGWAVKTRTGLAIINEAEAAWCV